MDLKLIEQLAARRRFGMKLGLDTIHELLTRLGSPERKLRAIHVAGTNGKGAVCAILDAALREVGERIGRYTSPHLVSLNERYFVNGRIVDDATLEVFANKVNEAIVELDCEVTFFEALTAIAFLLYSEMDMNRVILECGLGGRLDATNVCKPEICIITKIGLDHCEWLGDTVEKVAMEKAGIIKSGVPIVLGNNATSVRELIEARAREVGAPFYYAPEMTDETEIPSDFALDGKFNRENAITALAALKVLGVRTSSLKSVVWPGRLQRIGNFIIDGAHNPPAASALYDALQGRKYNLIAGFCGDKDVDAVLTILAPLVNQAFAVKTNNQRSLSAEDTAKKMCDHGIDARSVASLSEAISLSGDMPTLICGSLFLAGEALVRLGGYPWQANRFDMAELLKV